MEKVDYFDQLEDSSVLEKYKIGGIIVTKVINEVFNNAKVNTNIKTLFDIGLKLYDIEINKYFKKKKLENGLGISFPLSISLNEIAGYVTEIKEDIILRNNDLIKVEFGVHIDGYPSIACSTKIILDDDKECAINKKKSVLALNHAKTEALKLIKPESTNKKFVKKMASIVKEYGFNLLTCNGQHERAPGVISYQMSQNIIDGKNDEDTEDVHKLILLRGNDTFDFELFETEFEENEVYAIDIGISTGSGKISKMDNITNIYKRNNDKFYSLKMKSSKQVLGKINGYFPIDISKMSSPRFRFGLNECLKHNLVEEYPVMKENNNNNVGYSDDNVSSLKKQIDEMKLQEEERRKDDQRLIADLEEQINQMIDEEEQRLKLEEEEDKKNRKMEKHENKFAGIVDTLISSIDHSLPEIKQALPKKSILRRENNYNLLSDEERDKRDLENIMILNKVAEEVNSLEIRTKQEARIQEKFTNINYHNIIAFDGFDHYASFDLSSNERFTDGGIILDERDIESAINESEKAVSEATKQTEKALEVLKESVNKTNTGQLLSKVNLPIEPSNLFTNEVTDFFKF